MSPGRLQLPAQDHQRLCQLAGCHADLIVIINDATCMELSAPAQRVMHAHAFIAVGPLYFASGSGAEQLPDLLVDFILPPLGLNI